MRAESVDPPVIVAAKVALSWPLDFDDPGPEVGQLAGAEWRGNGLFQADDGHAVQRTDTGPESPSRSTAVCVSGRGGMRRRQLSPWHMVTLAQPLSVPVVSGKTQSVRVARRSMEPSAPYQRSLLKHSNGSRPSHDAINFVLGLAAPLEHGDQLQRVKLIVLRSTDIRVPASSASR